MSQRSQSIPTVLGRVERRTHRTALAQLIFCEGCCCGRTDRGKPELPVDRIREVWRNEGLNRSVQLTISGCLGPCDLTNVTLVLTAEGSQWLGDLAGNDIYDDLIEWAWACHAAGVVVPLPAHFDRYRFERFAAAEVPA